MVGVVYENLDLKRERSRCSFDKEEITNLIDGGKEKTQERRDLGEIKFHFYFCFINLKISIASVRVF
jgi:hypothetical protein